MYNGSKVLDVHSHVRPLRPSYLFFTDLMHSRYALESPIGPGKHSSVTGMRDEDTYVTINYGNISQNACAGQPCDFNFDIRPDFGPSGSREWGPYDFDSVMHYSACAFSTCAVTNNVACPPPAVICTTSCPTITVNPAWNAQWQGSIGQRCYLSRLDQFTMKFLYPEAGFRFVDRTNGGTQTGGFYWPLQTISSGANVTPSGGTLWIIKEGSYSAVGTYSTPMTIRAPLGATLGN